MYKVIANGQTPINKLPPGEYNMILRAKLIITPDKKFMQLTYSPLSKKVTGELKQLILIEDNSKEDY